MLSCVAKVVNSNKNWIVAGGRNQRVIDAEFSYANSHNPLQGSWLWDSLAARDDLMWEDLMDGHGMTWHSMGMGNGMECGKGMTWHSIGWDEWDGLRWDGWDEIIWATWNDMGHSMTWCSVAWPMQGMGWDGMTWPCLIPCHAIPPCLGWDEMAWCHRGRVLMSYPVRSIIYRALGDSQLVYKKPTI